MFRKSERLAKRFEELYWQRIALIADGVAGRGGRLSAREFGEAHSVAVHQAYALVAEGRRQVVGLDEVIIDLKHRAATMYLAAAYATTERDARPTARVAGSANPVSGSNVEILSLSDELYALAVREILESALDHTESQFAFSTGTSVRGSLERAIVEALVPGRNGYKLALARLCDQLTPHSDVNFSLAVTARGWGQMCAARADDVTRVSLELSARNEGSAVEPLHEMLRFLMFRIEMDPNRDAAMAGFESYRAHLESRRAGE